MTTIKPEVLDELLAGVSSPEDLMGDAGLFKQLKKALMERALGAELSHHLGYERGDPAGRGSGNSRNGDSAKTVLTEDGELDLSVPRDRAGTFEPRLVPKGQTRLDGFDGKVISLYARGLTVREIQGHPRELYGVEVSPDLISRVTDAVLEEVRDWQNRPLDPVYPVVFFDALRVKIRDEGGACLRLREAQLCGVAGGGLVKNKAVHVALALDQEGHKHVLGLWIERSEGAKFWLKVMNELKTRGVQDILIAVVDGLKGGACRGSDDAQHRWTAGGGFPEAIGAAFPETIVQTCIVQTCIVQTCIVQTCIVHLIRSSLAFVSWKDRKVIMPDLKAIYRAETAEAALDRLGDFEGKRGARYPAIGQARRRAWPHVIPLFAFPPAIRKMIYTTNAVESLHRSWRKIIKTRGSFPTDEAATKLLYLAIQNAGVHGRRPVEWTAAMSQFAILFGGRFAVSAR